jgi:D-inositol-3-phosphate glycosyltransferase
MAATGAEAGVRSTSVIPVRRFAPRRIATLSVHTSPLEQAGTGDAGGMNVYIVEMSKRLAAAGTEVEIFTRATSRDLPPRVELAPGVLVRHVTAGPLEGLPKEDLPAQLCAFTSGVLRAEASHELGWYDLVHAHYWLSGQVGWLAKERWGVPLIQSMHTMAKVKNSLLADGDTPEPRQRLIGEQQVVDVADRLIANTDEEARQLVQLYAADPHRVEVIHPGVDLEVFTPGDRRHARRQLQMRDDAIVLLFVGRLQPLKAPDLLLRAAARLLRDDPTLRNRLVVAIVGGPSGSGFAAPRHLEKLAAELGIAGVVRFQAPVPQTSLVDWYRAADVTVVPSYNESFGLVAVESQACGTPVVAAAVGGLTTAVRDGISGILVEGHDAAKYAQVLRTFIDPPEHSRARWKSGALQHAQSFGWSAAAARMIDVYASAMNELREPPRIAVGR